MPELIDHVDQLNSSSLIFVEELYAEYLRDPESVTADWRQYFQQLGDGQSSAPQRVQIGPSFRPSSMFAPPAPLAYSDSPASTAKVAAIGHSSGNGASANGNGATEHSAASNSNGHQHGPVIVPRAAQDPLDVAILQERVDQLIRAYRVRGHMVALIDPLGLHRDPLPELEPATYNLTEADLDRTVSTDSIEGPQTMTIRRIVERLRNTYCRSIGVQFMHMDDLAVRLWLQHRMERCENRITLGRKEQLRILNRLTNAVVFEEFIQKRFLGAKSFSLEGAESLIPLLEMAIEKAGEEHIDEIVMGMAHRGRLNVLANIMGKSAQQIFREFADIDPELHIGRGDVKYHLGHSTDWKTDSGHRVHISLCFNPSHLEFVNPVVLGRLRAKQDRVGDYDRQRGLGILIHGDAAFAGEGVIQETLNLSQLNAYRTGGTLHVIVNNQIGFTTSPSQARSCQYATDVAKMLQLPIFHVNGEDPEAVAQVVRLAMDFREAFQRDVVIDMYCYRRRGHNEADEPAFTQPDLYRAIEQRKTVREGYLDFLLELGGVSREEADRMADDHRQQLDQELSVARSHDYHHKFEAPGIWSLYVGGREREAADVPTGCKLATLQELLTKQSEVPADFTPHPKLQRILDERCEMAAGNRPLNWAAAESLAYATLLTQGLTLRMTGQDCERGTFSHRHAVLHDVHDGHTYMPLAHLSSDQARIEIVNSPLSEIGVLGFEYGYSLDTPDGLTIWEAQFGDFTNVAQVVIDQFIISAEDKWKRLSGLVMLLPHGFEGQGPEHSSARLERFLQLAAKDNMQICNATTPAQFYHLLRRQVLREWRKPLIVMTPKSMLRHPKVVSSLEEMTGDTEFQRIIPDQSGGDPAAVQRVLLCSGKIYWELEEQRASLKRDNVAIIRLEQLYPLAKDRLKELLACYRDGTPVFWVQEEPENMGAWRYLKVIFGDRMFDRLPFAGISRATAASPATGSASSHRLEQQEIYAKSFAVA